MELLRIFIKMRVFMSNKSATNNRCIDIISRLHTLSFWSLVLVQKIVALMSPQHSVVKPLSSGAYAHKLLEIMDYTITLFME